MLRKLLPPTGRAARFADGAMHVGLVDLGDRQAHCLFNWSDGDERRQITLPRAQQVRDLWTDEDLGRLAAGAHGFTLPPHSARVLIAT